MTPQSISLSRSLISLLVLTTFTAGAFPAAAQQATNAAADSNLTQSIQELREQIQELRAAVSEIKSEAAQYRAENQELRKELVAWVRKDIGPIASPDLIQFAPGLPKTRSGKIMRRILRKIAEDEPSSLGDTSTLADPAVVDDLVAHRQNKKGA